MKKLLLTLTLILSVFALSAQSYIVTEKESGIIVENGATYYVWGEGDDFGELNIKFNVTANENIRLIGEKVENVVVDSTSNYFCWGDCLASSNYVSEPVNMTEGMVEEFSMHFTHECPIELVLGQQQSMTYYLYPGDDPDNKFTINVFFMFSMDSMEDAYADNVLSNAYPVPASDFVNFDYSFVSDVKAEIAIYNMMGQEVLRNTINGMSGKASLNVSDLADGIYFYSLIVNGKIEKSNKLIVRK